ncbi:MAG: sulfotransferase, partial [Rubrobacteraceae bacterium]|nr:sulfotransferase [Rubrobacteraceae bacterium]
MTMPNFLIIGAMKAGTTALYSYLEQHPEVYMSPVKEPNFFCFEGETLDFRAPQDQEGINRTSVTHIDDYRALFRGVRGEAAVGEASHWYLYHPKAPERIRRHVPDARLIAVLRDPVERAYSQFLHFVRDGQEPLTVFAQALGEEERRMRDHWAFGRYASRGFYYSQLRRYYDLFDRSRIKVYLYEDLKADAPALLQDTFRFLEVDPTFVPELSVQPNVSGIPRNRVLHEVLTGSGRTKAILK